jgi:hypothetical protein
MNIRFRLPTLFLLVFVLFMGSAYGQHIFKMQAYDLPIQVLSQEVFESKFGDNPLIPRANQEVIALAERLYPSLSVKARVLPQQAAIEDECGEKNVGVLFAALKNPEISDVTRTIVDDIIAAAIPPLPKSKISDSGHFQIFYTSNDADARNNVTDAQVDSLATNLDSLWEPYAVNFKEPKHKLVGNQKRIDVKVYLIWNALGQTNSDWDHIELNSKLCVRDSCKRRTTPAHELFHRVQYVYGYISSIATMDWMVEGTASWSQKFTYQSIRDYMDRMNSGLKSPWNPLIEGRKYDACHFWVYLQEKAGDSAIAQVWSTYETNGFKAKAAVDSVTSDLLKLNFDKFVAKWSKANYIKELVNAKKGGYDYDENAVTKTSCGATHGPLDKVMITGGGIIDQDSDFTRSGNVKPYAADYYVFTLGETLKDLAVKFKGTGWFELSFIGIKDNAWKSITNKAHPKYFFGKSLTAGEWDKLAVMVMSKAVEGHYSLTVGGCIDGTWLGGNGTWELYQDGTSITGTMKQDTCGTVNVTGTYDSPHIILNTDIAVAGCCSYKWEGTVTDCQSISGTWTRTGGGPRCIGYGGFTLAKQILTSGESPAAIERKEEPTCCIESNIK